jgi:hypothetical protein
LLTLRGFAGPKRMVFDIHDGEPMVTMENRRTICRWWYGEERAAQVKCAEAFEICEYGRKLNQKLRKLFPFFAPTGK